MEIGPFLTFGSFLEVDSDCGGIVGSACFVDGDGDAVVLFGWPVPPLFLEVVHSIEEAVFWQDDLSGCEVGDGNICDPDC